jgi:putative flippase GtrA
MNLVLKYVLFCIFATFVNLLTQRFFLNSVLTENNYFIALSLGTITGLVTKYFLDKKYIFSDYDNSLKNSYKKFSLYSLNGILTTTIFWASETLFFFGYKTDFARELGAIIGLSIGYFLKYKLDKKYVFQK